MRGLVLVAWCLWPGRGGWENIDGQKAMPKRNLIWAFALLAVAGGMVWLSRSNPARPQTGPLVQAYKLIKDWYYRELSDEELLRGAIEGMMDQLDPFSVYIPPGKMAAIEARLQGRQTGLGLRLEIVDAQVYVIGPVKGSPADEARIVPGDRIVCIDARPVAGLGLEEVRKMLAGQVGSTVNLTLFRAAGGEETLTLTRATYSIETLTGLYRDRTREWVYLVDPSRGVAYVRIREFVAGTSSKLQQCLRQLDRYKALVVDLRDNPGGPLESGVAFCNLFLSEGTIVSVVSRRGPGGHHRATAEGTYPGDIRLVVLVNGETASAAEIVAGALRMHDRAVLVGTRTRGKGSIQSILPLPRGLGRINLTVSQFRVGGTEPISRIEGRDKWGIDPHEQVAIHPSYLRRLSRLRDEAEILRPPGPTTMPARGARRAEDLADRIIGLDQQLARGLEILRSPMEYEAILKRAAAERQERAKARAGAKPPGSG